MYLGAGADPPPPLLRRVQVEVDGVNVHTSPRRFPEASTPPNIQMAPFKKIDACPARAGGS